MKFTSLLLLLGAGFGAWWMAGMNAWEYLPAHSIFSWERAIGFGFLGLIGGWLLTFFLIGLLSFLWRFFLARLREVSRAARGL